MEVASRVRCFFTRCLFFFFARGEKANGGCADAQDKVLVSATGEPLDKDGIAPGAKRRGRSSSGFTERRVRWLCARRFGLV